MVLLSEEIIFPINIIFFRLQSFDLDDLWAAFDLEVLTMVLNQVYS